MKHMITMSVIVLAVFAKTASWAEQESTSRKSARETPKRGPGEFALRADRRPRRAITNAPFISAREVTDQVSDNELVLGVVIRGEPRAYPINQLTGPSREIVNDTLGGRAIAATW